MANYHYRASNYNRNITVLESKATFWWPSHLTKLESSTSIIPLLLKSQDEFISILTLCKGNPQNVFKLIEASDFPANLFLKHLVVLSDFGGEKLQRLNKNFDSIFPVNKDEKKHFEFYWNDTEHEYIFKSLPIDKLLNNKAIKIDSESLSKESPLDDLTKDVIMILLFGSNAINPKVLEVLNQCEVGNLIGKPDELERFIKQRYIHVSRITGGAEANKLGQVAQTYVIDFLRNKLIDEYTIITNGHIGGVTHNDGRTETTFDIVITKNRKSVAIEVSFQVTTNSTIERKAGQAKARYDMVSNSGNFIAYIIDGAGNFQRRSAITTICENSHCTVAYTDEELNVLADFIKTKLP